VTALWNRQGRHSSGKTQRRKKAKETTNKHLLFFERFCGTGWHSPCRLRLIRGLILKTNDAIGQTSLQNNAA
jgi:hypothetical protein